MGDYNTNTLSESNKTIKHVNEFSNIFASNYYHKLITVYTRVIVDFLSPKYSFILGGSTFTRGTFLAI